MDRHTRVNLLPWPNFVAAGKNGTHCANGVAPLQYSFEGLHFSNFRTLVQSVLPLNEVYDKFLSIEVFILVPTIEIDVRALKERGLGHVMRVKMSGDACNHTHKWQLLRLNMGLNGNF